MPRPTATARVVAAIALLLAHGAKLLARLNTNGGMLVAKLNVGGAATVQAAEVNQNERDSHSGFPRVGQEILFAKLGRFEPVGSNSPAAPVQDEDAAAGGADIVFDVCAPQPFEINYPHARPEAFLRSESSPLPDRQYLSKSPHLRL